MNEDRAEVVTNKLLGTHFLIQKANAQALCVAPFPSRVLLLGETGTGKSRLARYIHDNGGRTDYKTITKVDWDKINGVELREMLAWASGIQDKHRRDDIKKVVSDFEEKLKENPNGFSLNSDTFLEANLAALPKETISAELFGYVRGAFTDARTEGSPGLFIQANGGTLFLDEIAECPLDIQAKLLTVIQPRDEKDGACACYVIPNGQTEEVRVNVRLICATNKDLFEEVEKGKFRRDLYYRLKEYEIKLPSLMQIKELESMGKPGVFYIKEYVNQILDEINKRLDIRDIKPEFKKKKFREDAENALLRYSFPGNYRELESILVQACLNARTRYVLWNGEEEDGTTIKPDDLPEYVAKARIPCNQSKRECCLDESSDLWIDEFIRIGWCSECDWKQIRKIVHPEAMKSATPKDIRELASLIFLLKKYGGNKDLKEEDFAGKFKGQNSEKSQKSHGDQTFRTLLGRFGITFRDLQKSIGELYW